jgi:hypothetical protein
VGVPGQVLRCASSFVGSPLSHANIGTTSVYLQLIEALLKPGELADDLVWAQLGWRLSRSQKPGEHLRNDPLWRAVMCLWVKTGEIGEVAVVQPRRC